ncbi:MAG TPA: hypothetical protein PLX69_09485 [Leptospiraceae bacterium]|nr:hypothetical protein [Leptospiraceae bacterium]HRG74778.1 hypothetical protein [Leptospiraceae bacterium]
MSFFSDIKNKITGGGAKINLEFSNLTLAAPFQVKMVATISDSADLKVDKVYLKIRSSEIAVINRASVSTDDNNSQSFNETVFTKEFSLSGSQVLTKGKTYEWTQEIALPSECKPTFTGKMIFHEWYVLGGLEVPGNDPDSGWTRIELK